ncbi:ABC transporter ATP-binding protein [Paramicrobacterium fandaimingii]|uniref:ABC transporter ATP-binding protein n=1 Tax=Paramicrobacterium fandaimingii TaxID=2708079 RepID=UPI0014239047|nr:ABC transporter ATP-binding protein [Microbacterium fandaimingii]
MTERNDDRILGVDRLSVEYGQGKGSVVAVDGVTFAVNRGEFVGLVGESGSGKTTLGFALTRLLTSPARITGGTIEFEGRDISEIGGEELRQMRHRGIAMVLQSGMNALNPVRTIQNHFVDVMRAHEKLSKKEVLRRSIPLLEKVHLSPDVLSRYPHELSGGMRQRTAIAIALALEPKLMVFDEPTTALDVLVQRRVVETIKVLQENMGFTAILISHDLGLVLETTDRVMVMRQGEIVERGTASDILERPQHQYTQMLLESYVDPSGGRDQLREKLLRRADHAPADNAENDSARDPNQETAPATTSSTSAGWASRSLVVEDALKIYPGRRRDPAVTAVDGVSFELNPGEAVALVGASGSGKSTLARLVSGMEKPTSGTVSFGDGRVDKYRSRQLVEYRRHVQMVFQDPYSSLNPLQNVAYILSRPLINHARLSGDELLTRAGELLERVGLTPVSAFGAKMPHELSGGERQRVVIARALASEPEVIIADEPVSMLDVSLRAEILSLLEDLRTDLGMSMLYITHDLHSAQAVTDRTLVLNKGQIVESGSTEQVLRHPNDEYTRSLIAAIPNPYASTQQ